MADQSEQVIQKPVISGDNKFPLKTVQIKSELIDSRGNQRKVDVVVTPFRDRIVIVVSEKGKLGTWIEAFSDGEVVDPTIQDGAEASYTVRTLLGRRDEPLLDVFARQLVQRLHVSQPGKNLLLNISLRIDSDRSLIKQLLVLFQQNSLL